MVSPRKDFGNTNKGGAKMTTVEEILKEPEIAQFLNTHQGAAAEINRAAEFMAPKPDAVKTIKKLFPAFEKRVIFVFFSYKKKDEATAKKVVEILRQNSAERLQITYQADFAQMIAGQRWREWIHEKVKEANWFILLLPDPSDDYDWCLFETGQFEAQLTPADRMICLHHPDSQVPDPIEGYHAVPATETEVEKFLRMVYVEENPIPGMGAINHALEPRLTELAKNIVDAISPPKQKLRREIYEPWIELKIQNAKDLKDKDDLDQAEIMSSNKEALDLFDFIIQPKTLGELRSEMVEQKEDGRWLNELFHVIRRVAVGRKFYPIQAVFQTKTGKIYRPVFCAVDRNGDEGPIHSFHITFTEEVSAIDRTAIPGPIAGVGTVLRFAYRFKWEVIERFGTNTLKDEDVVRLDNAIRRINKDWESRGIGEKENVINLFSNGQAKRVAKMFVIWNKLKNPEGTGELDIAIENSDTQKIQEILNGLIPINQEFLELAIMRFTELLSIKS
jgi:hypothetical protein